ncbi:type II secretion system protein [Evansella tamaricis]|uniref:Type II secretion system GspH family protein n=1 Tax=Evansella tamaricis TaxID=2069301 RepID=A0ABS6JIE9_9BACI|nr:type II secretion system protein [Evansella tamaricis]MBU9712235.1 type II secretion system GspH family protein [Evansella tamaricis]
MINNKGFSYIEVMCALLLFSIAVSTILPALVTVQQERLTIRQERYIEEFLNKEIYDLKSNGNVEEELSIVNDGVEYQIHSVFSNGRTVICAYWEGGNGRYYERCLLGKKERGWNDSY